MSEQTKAEQAAEELERTACELISRELLKLPVDTYSIAVKHAIECIVKAAVLRSASIMTDVAKEIINAH